jgi:hypothetical protein
LENFNRGIKSKFISLGYRIKSRIATQFRIWATQRLKEYIIKGFTMDDERLKNIGGGGYWYELLNRIRDIRSSVYWFYFARTGSRKSACRIPRISGENALAR